MGLAEAVILGIVQGLTEFLPVSSSGHLVLFQKLFGVEGEVLSFDLAVHLATLIAVCSVLWKDLWEILKRPFGKLPLLILVGTVPTALIGFLFKDTVERLFETGKSLGLEFLLTGAVLLLAENAVKPRNKGLEETGWKDALLVGTAQGIAILPAVSRSGLTIAGALGRGLERGFALKFSFLLSIPAILGPALLDGLKLAAGEPLGVPPAVLAAGMAAAGLSGYFSVKFMLRLFSKASLKVFSYYVFAVGSLVLLDQLFFGIFFEKLF